MKIIIPEIPPSWNQIMRMHHHQQDAETKKWALLVRAYAGRRDVPRFTGKVKVKITYYFKDKIKRDPDNYSGKFINDGLVAAGIIEDDSFQHIDLEIVGGLDKESPRVEIEVTPL